VPRPRHRAGLAWYWLALLILLGVRATDLRIASFTRVPLPAGGRVSLPHGGTYVIDYEAAGASEGILPHFRVRARPLTPSLRVGLQVNTSDDMYGAGRIEGIAVLNLKVSGPGRVYLDGPGAPAVAGGSALAVGPGLPGFQVTVMPGIGLMLLGIGGIILTATLRSRGAVKRVRYRPIAA
jgi:hypothetical protein